MYLYDKLVISKSDLFMKKIWKISGILGSIIIPIYKSSFS